MLLARLRAESPDIQIPLDVFEDRPAPAKCDVRFDGAGQVNDMPEGEWAERRRGGVDGAGVAGLRIADDPAQIVIASRDAAVDGDLGAHRRKRLLRVGAACQHHAGQRGGGEQRSLRPHRFSPSTAAIEETLHNLSARATASPAHVSAGMQKMRERVARRRVSYWYCTDEEIFDGPTKSRTFGQAVAQPSRPAAP